MSYVSMFVNQLVRRATRLHNLAQTYKGNLVTHADYEQLPNALAVLNYAYLVVDIVEGEEGLLLALNPATDHPGTAIIDDKTWYALPEEMRLLSDEEMSLIAQ